MKMNQLSTLYRADHLCLMQDTGIKAEPTQFDGRKKHPTGVHLGARSAVANPCTQKGLSYLFVLFVPAK